MRPLRPFTWSRLVRPPKQPCSLPRRPTDRGKIPSNGCEHGACPGDGYRHRGPSRDGPREAQFCALSGRRGAADWLLFDRRCSHLRRADPRSEQEHDHQVRHGTRGRLGIFQECERAGRLFRDHVFRPAQTGLGRDAIDRSDRVAPGDSRFPTGTPRFSTRFPKGPRICNRRNTAARRC